MDVQAKARYIRISPRKVRLVLDAVRNMKATDAVIHLSLLPQKSARPVKKLIESAIANAEHNFKLASADLTIKKLVADDGPTLKRYRPRAFGRAAMIRKRTSHITVVLTDGKAEVVKAEKTEKKETAKAEAAPVKKSTKKPAATKKAADKKETAKKTATKKETVKKSKS